MTFYAKLWTDIIGDEKLMRAARKGSKQLVVLPWLIAFAKKADDEGRLTVGEFPAEPDDIAAGIPGVTARQVSEGLRSLQAIGVLVADDDGALRFASWRRRNWMAPSDTPEQVRGRVAKHRAATRVTPNEPTSVTGSVTTPVTSSVTRGVTTARSRDVDVDEDLDQNRDKDRDVDGDASAAATPTAREAAIATTLTTDAGRNALTAIIAKAPNKLAWVQEIAVALDGMHGPALTPAQLDEALRDYVGNGAFERPNLKSFRNYLRVAAQPPAAVTGSGRGEPIGFVEALARSKAARDG